MKVAIIEDNEGALKSLKRDLADFYPNLDIIGHKSTVSEGIEYLKTCDAELLFMDVNLPDGTCFDILQRIDYKRFKIIFCSAYDKYAINAFRYSAVDYLLKPIKVDELKEAMSKVLNDNEQSTINVLLENAKQIERPKKMALTNSDGTYIIEITNLIYIEANGNYSNVFTTEREKYLLISKTMKSFESLLKNGEFMRVHHTYIVNMNHVLKFVSKDGGYLILKNGTNIPVSQRKRPEIVKYLDSLQ